MPLEAHASRPAPGALRALSVNRRGAALPEYALLLGLFLAVVVGLVTGMGSHLRSIFSKANTELQSGDCATSGNCSVASVPPGSGSSGGSGGSGRSGASGSSSSEGGASGSGGTPGGGGTPRPPDHWAPDPSGGSSGGGGSGGSEPSPTLDIHPR